MKLHLRRAAVQAMLLASLIVGSPLWAEEGSLTPELAKSLRQSVKMDATTRAVQNALTANSPQALVVNRAIVQAHDTVFSHKIKAREITNQRASGRCWLFAALNIVRPMVIEKHKLKDFEFSESYLSFWDKVEKANAFLEDMIALADREPFDRELDFLLKEPMTDGGYWEWFVALVEKYGAVPKSVMPETFSSQDTKVMNLVLERKLRIDAARLRAMVGQKRPKTDLRAAKEKMLTEIYRVLILHYGQPPAEFTYRFVDKNDKVGKPKRYTPQSFFKECVGADLGQYVTLCNDPTHPYRKHYRLRHMRNIVGSPEMHYVNVPVDTLRQLALKSVLAGESVWFGADALDDMDRTEGIMKVNLFDYGALYGVDLAQGKAERLLTRDTEANHSMTFIGVDVIDKKPVKWLVENSWGKERGDKGLWTMYADWFDQYVFSIVVRKAYVPNDLLEIYKEPTIELPPWAPMFTPLR